MLEMGAEDTPQTAPSRSVGGMFRMSSMLWISSAGAKGEIAGRQRYETEGGGA